MKQYTITFTKDDIKSVRIDSHQWDAWVNIYLDSGSIIRSHSNELKNLNKSFKMMSNTFEIYQKTNISNGEKNELFKAFSRGSEGKVYLLNQALEKQDNLTLWDIYNAFTNYSEHNKRSISVGKRNKPKEIPKEYEIRQSNMDKIKSNEARSAEVQDFIHNNNLFIFYKGRGLSNQVHSN